MTNTVCDFLQTHALLPLAPAEALIQQVIRSAEARLPDFRPDEMATLLYGLSHLASAPPHCDPPPRLGPIGHTGVAGGAAMGEGLSVAGAGVGVDSEPALSPEGMQLFYGVVRQCIRLIEEPGQPAPTPRAPQHTTKPIQYPVLNSIVFSCLRVGYTPWTLIDFAESRGIRLVQPSAVAAEAEAALGDGGSGGAWSQATAGWAAGAGTKQPEMGRGGQISSLGKTLVGPPPRAAVTWPGQASRGPTGKPPPEFEGSLPSWPMKQRLAAHRRSGRRPALFGAGSGEAWQGAEAQQWEGSQEGLQPPAHQSQAPSAPQERVQGSLRGPGLGRSPQRPVVLRPQGALIEQGGQSLERIGTEQGDEVPPFDLRNGISVAQHMGFRGAGLGNALRVM